ncbi:MAG: hypothetical protein ACI94Y_000780 [Maribacter sp.]|jgi:hypothetical protein
MKLKSIIYFISTIFFASCGNKYVKTDNQWSWSSNNEGGKQVKKMIVDNASFAILADKRYAKDKNKVYLGNSIVVSANPFTFQVLEWSYGKDKTHISTIDEFTVTKSTEHKSYYSTSSFIKKTKNMNG